ncbi:MAG: tRNA pseudouridine(55) synthase TruB [Chloroflexia bacterium]
MVSQVRRFSETRRVGHIGTLDPFASGVLPIAVGRATRLADTLHTFPKTYLADIRFGLGTTTRDIEGEPVGDYNPHTPTRDEVEHALLRFVGEIEQTPPAFSAARIGGRRAHELARAGEEVHLEPRRVTIYSATVRSRRRDRVEIEVECSTGTYIRSLAVDRVGNHRPPLSAREDRSRPTNTRRRDDGRGDRGGDYTRQDTR